MTVKQHHTRSNSNFFHVLQTPHYWKLFPSPSLSRNLEDLNVCLSREEKIILNGQQTEKGEKQRHCREEMPQIVIVVELCKSEIKHTGLQAVPKYKDCWDCCHLVDRTYTTNTNLYKNQPIIQLKLNILKFFFLTMTSNANVASLEDNHVLILHCKIMKEN